MTDKSFVSLGQHQCPVCGTLHDSGEILMDRRIKNTLDKHTVTGVSMCPEHKKLADDGFVALVEIDPAKSAIPKDAQSVRSEDAFRTGSVAHLKARAFGEVFGEALPPGMIAFVEVGIIDRLKAMTDDA